MRQWLRASRWRTLAQRPGDADAAALGPQGQIYDRVADCRAELRTGSEWHMVRAAAKHGQLLCRAVQAPAPTSGTPRVARKRRLRAGKVSRSVSVRYHDSAAYGGTTYDRRRWLRADALFMAEEVLKENLHLGAEAYTRIRPGAALGKERAAVTCRMGMRVGGGDAGTWPLGCCGRTTRARRGLDGRLRLRRGGRWLLIAGGTCVPGAVHRAAGFAGISGAPGVARAVI